MVICSTHSLQRGQLIFFAPCLTAKLTAKGIFALLLGGLGIVAFELSQCCFEF